MSRARDVKKKRLILFQRGAAAAQRYTDSSEFYYCPICRTGFNQSALSTDKLTLEHVPPASAGGKSIALTCKSCNNRAGDSIDAAISHRAELVRFADVSTHTIDGEGGRAILEVGREHVNILLVAESNGPVRLEILGGSNDPRVVERVQAYMEEHTRENSWTGGALGIASRRLCDPRLASIGDLKAAFIAAFAAFGYRYACNPRLDQVRQQIRNPAEQVIDMWSIAIDHTGIGRYLLLFTEPLPGVVVSLGRSCVLLPWLDSPVNFYTALATAYRPNEQPQVTGHLIKWPTTLEMVLDF